MEKKPEYEVLFERGTITAPVECFEMCFHQGECEHDVKWWIDSGEVDFSNFPDDKIREELSEYGAWEDDELQDVSKNRERILWIAAENAQDEWDECPELKGESMNKT